MNRIFAVSLLALMSCACAGPERLVPDSSIVPRFPPPPVDTATPAGPAMLPWLKCLQEKGSLSCPGPDSPASAGSTTPSAPKP
jgi:hypothetical protein